MQEPSSLFVTVLVVIVDLRHSKPQNAARNKYAGDVVEQPPGLGVPQMFEQMRREDRFGGLIAEGDAVAKIPEDEVATLEREDRVFADFRVS